MGWFRRKKKEVDPRVEACGIEQFRIAGLMQGHSVEALQDLERKLFGKTFNDILLAGRSVGLVLKSPEGSYWTAFGRIGRHE